MNCLNNAVANGMVLHAWKDNQTDGVWVALGESEAAVMAIQAFSVDSLSNNIALKKMIYSGNELPVAVGETLDMALKDLDVRLKDIPLKQFMKKSDYRSGVIRRYAQIVTHGSRCGDLVGVVV